MNYTLPKPNTKQKQSKNPFSRPNFFRACSSRPVILLPSPKFRKTVPVQLKTEGHVRADQKSEIDCHVCIARDLLNKIIAAICFQLGQGRHTCGELSFAILKAISSFLSGRTSVSSTSTRWTLRNFQIYIPTPGTSFAQPGINWIVRGSINE